MSDVESSITARLGTGNEELIKAMEALAEAVRKAVKADQPERFEHTDGDDSLVVRPHHVLDQTLVAFVNGDSVRLDQDAVNGLAQYLDRYRTDTQCPMYCLTGHEPEQCAGVREHDGPCSLDADMIDQPNPFVHTGYTNGAPVQPREHWCGRNSDHPGHEYTREEGTRSVRCLGVNRSKHGGAPGPTVDLDAFYCAGYVSGQPSSSSGCGHPRDAHGALGCNAVTDCPCERRNGS